MLLVLSEVYFASSFLLSVSKQLFEKTNSDVTDIKRLTIKFDIKDFYPCITEIFLQQRLKFAKQHKNINKNDLSIINHCCKSLLFSDNNTWKRKLTYSCFDVTICELVEKRCFQNQALDYTGTMD